MQFLIFQKKKPHRNKKAAKNDCLIYFLDEISPKH